MGDFNGLLCVFSTVNMYFVEEEKTMKGVVFILFLNFFYFLFFKGNFIFIYLFIYLWLCWVFIAAQAFSSCGERGLLFIVVRRLLIVVVSLVVEHGL